MSSPDRLDLVFTGPVTDFERSIINLLKNRKTLVGTPRREDSETEEEEDDEETFVTASSSSLDTSYLESSLKTECGMPVETSLLHSLQKQMEEVYVQQPLPVALQERLSHHPAYQPQVEPEVPTLVGELNRKELGSRGSGGCRPPSAWVDSSDNSSHTTFQDVVVVDLEKSDPFLHDTLSLMDPAILNLHSSKPPEKNSLEMGVASSVDPAQLPSFSKKPQVNCMETTPVASKITFQDDDIDDLNQFAGKQTDHVETATSVSKMPIENATMTDNATTLFSPVDQRGRKQIHLEPVIMISKSLDQNAVLTVDPPTEVVFPFDYYQHSSLFQTNKKVNFTPVASRIPAPFTNPTAENVTDNQLTGEQTDYVENSMLITKRPIQNANIATDNATMLFAPVDGDQPKVKKTQVEPLMSKIPNENVGLSVDTAPEFVTPADHNQQSSLLWTNKQVKITPVASKIPAPFTNSTASHSPVLFSTPGNNQNSKVKMRPQTQITNVKSTPAHSKIPPPPNANINVGNGLVLSTPLGSIKQNSKLQTSKQVPHVKASPLTPKLLTHYTGSAVSNASGLPTSNGSIKTSKQVTHAEARPLTPKIPAQYSNPAAGIGSEMSTPDGNGKLQTGKQGTPKRRTPLVSRIQNSNSAASNKLQTKQASQMKPILSKVPGHVANLTDVPTLATPLKQRNQQAQMKSTPSTNSEVDNQRAQMKLTPKPNTNSVVDNGLALLMPPASSNLQNGQKLQTNKQAELSKVTPTISKIPVKNAPATLPRRLLARNNPPNTPLIPISNKEEFKENSNPNFHKLPKLHSCLFHETNNGVNKTGIPRMNQTPSAKTTSAKIKKKWSVDSPVSLYIHEIIPHPQSGGGPLKPIQEATLAQWDNTHLSTPDKRI